MITWLFNQSKYLRIWYYHQILKYINRQQEFNRIHGTNYDPFLCYFSYNNLYPCFKNLKEVKNNLNSDYISKYINTDRILNCTTIWFTTNDDRTKFIDECLTKL